VLRLCRSHPLVEALGGLAPLLMGRHFSSRDTRAGIKKHPMAPLIAAKSFSQKEDASSSILCRPCALVHASAVPTSNARITIACPDCGLALHVVSEAGLFRYNYDLGDWQRLCKRRDLGDAAWCLLQHNRTSS